MQTRQQLPSKEEKEIIVEGGRFEVAERTQTKLSGLFFTCVNVVCLIVVYYCLV